MWKLYSVFMLSARQKTFLGKNSDHALQEPRMSSSLFRRVRGFKNFQEDGAKIVDRETYPIKDGAKIFELGLR